ncbi:hypothetical protein ACFQWH_09385 [Mycolicibacterium sp. GCM10028919]|uniref:hypothetical protein n=1 Tax=Mycolicibacterium sp. GCM10028919 TaxID=3273401 RepID=UPI00360F2FB6
MKLPDAEGREVWAFPTVDMSGFATPKQVVDRTWNALSYIAGRIEKPADRPRPLIGIPLPGTGRGGLEEHRSKVIERLLKRLRKPLSVDVALVLRDRRDFAAVQVRRPDGDWSALPQGLRRHADRLGVLAAHGELSLFLGAGVSVPVGMPGWWDLLDALADEPKVAHPRRDQDQFEAAAPIVKALGTKKYRKAMRRQLKKRQYGIGHAMLASLGAQRMVTTNFDRCMESALAAGSPHTFRVLTRQLVSGDSPWLLKINRDLHMLTMDPESATDGAYVLEIFLDRLLWTAATRSDLSSEYLLDDRYASGLTKRDTHLRDLLLSIPAAASTQAKSSPGWRRVEKCLRELGADEARLS